LQIQGKNASAYSIYKFYWRRYDWDEDGALEKEQLDELVTDFKCFNGGSRSSNGGGGGSGGGGDEGNNDGGRGGGDSGNGNSSGSGTEYPDDLLAAIGWEKDAAPDQLCHKSHFVTYMLDSRVDALHEVLNISDNEVFDNEGKKMNTGIMKSRSSKQLRSKNQ